MIILCLTFYEKFKTFSLVLIITKKDDLRTTFLLVYYLSWLNVHSQLHVFLE